jgi:hypothetical protein
MSAGVFPIDQAFAAGIGAGLPIRDLHA